MNYKVGQEVMYGNSLNHYISSVKEIKGNMIIVDGYIFDSKTGKENKELWGRYSITNDKRKINKFKKVIKKGSEIL